MGQQQLLLVILVTIIVGIATVVAINTFGAAADSANVDAVRQDLASIGAAAQGFYMKPAMLGGGGRTFDGSSSDAASEITFNDIAFGATVLTETTQARNDNGEYEIISTSPDDMVLHALPSSGGSIAARVCPDRIVMGDYNVDGETPPAPNTCDGEAAQEAGGE